ncbi:hypothetical protein ASPZODRAFT_793977 [Penicilliopsis zonata CBS 506.65]|uniref:Nitrate reductase [NADPH] n=1 Tax=Penicilliopsis zonata CBS 506.65 TaxID=1073090 RepID=A0A1L9SB89_9EURO|nr:hypothetical protein ASPZODRAFT_793977 [Penicilliopsis zonata CBS 506.65]OJJ44442.1 hypothetical protein ASPZODRAFT_793977 [Penicilliopsis zonata CBS 506.65]
MFPFQQVTVRDFPGCTAEEIDREPDWTHSLSHRIGLRGRDDRFMGFTNSGEAWRYDIDRDAEKKLRELRQKAESGALLTVRDFMEKQEKYYLLRPDVHPRDSRFMLNTTEGFIKDGQPWPANKQKQREQKRDQTDKPAETVQETVQGEGPAAHGMFDKGKNGLTPAQRSLVQLLVEEGQYITSLENNDGHGFSPVLDVVDLHILEVFQFTPDNWVPRYAHLARLTGKHPLNAEIDPTTLFEAGLITPSGLHYVRNHGAVPALQWETHKLEVRAGSCLRLSMDELKDRFSPVNIPVLLGCVGNRRKELNMLKRTKGANFTTCAVGCAYWKGALLRDVLLAADVAQLTAQRPNARLHVNFEGMDEPTEGRYATSLVLDTVMDEANDLLLAYEMNDGPLSPDHGYPLRLIAPGFVAARSIKWLTRIWVSDRENDSQHHIYDNRVIPGFITEMDSRFADAMFRHPSTICMEQALNSVIMRPAHGERLAYADPMTDRLYRIQGYAYSGGGNAIARIEATLDGGANWLYCVRKYPQAPIRHGRKFWTWLHWHVDVDVNHLQQAEAISVRCVDVFMNTQPEKPVWNLLGMMNNCWYTVKPEKKDSNLLFRHPCEPGTGTEGWMKPAPNNHGDHQMPPGMAAKQFTREEIEKHFTEDDCWIVVNETVYDVTSVLAWHPGGKATIMAHAGRVHQDTTLDFDSVHDDYAYGKLGECAIGSVTAKGMDFIRREARLKAEQSAEEEKLDVDMGLTRSRYSQAKLVRKKRLSEDHTRYTFRLPSSGKRFGLEVGQHVQVGFHFADRTVLRPFTPIRPLFPDEYDGTFDLVIKTHFADNNQPGGTLTTILDQMIEGDCIEVKGPSGAIRYRDHGKFRIDETDYTFKKVTFIVGGTGITPAYQVLAHMLLTPDDETKIRLVDANKAEEDILMRDEMDQLQATYPDKFQVVHVLSRPSKTWQGERGRIDKERLQKYSFAPGDDSAVFVCGPPPLIEKTIVPVMVEWGYRHDTNFFGF